jgi:hypothetical protein
MRPGMTFWLALIAVGVGWFFMSTFVTHLGAAGQTLRFYELWPVLLKPARLLTGAGRAYSNQHHAFGAVAGLVLLLPLLPLAVKNKMANLGFFAPLLLMLVCFAVLYAKTSGAYFSVEEGTGVFRAQVFNMANRLAGGLGGAASRRISIGSGAYLAAAGCLALACTGVVRLLRAKRVGGQQLEVRRV